MAAVLCALQQQQQRAEYARGACAGARGCWPLLRMAVLCSGFPSPCAEHAEVLRAQAPLRLPSLHIYGGARDADRQVRGLPATVRAPLSTRRTAPKYACQLRQAGCRVACGRLCACGALCSWTSLHAASGAARALVLPYPTLTEREAPTIYRPYTEVPYRSRAAAAAQVAIAESEALAGLFAADCRHVVAHAGGHHVPACKAHLARYRAFLSAFL